MPDFDLGSLQYELEVDAKSAEKAIDNFNDAVDSAENNLKRLDNQAKKNAQTLQNNFKKAAVAGSTAVLGLVTAIGAAATIMGKNAIEASSKLEESINAVNVVFGEASEGILKLSEDSAKSLGLASSDFNAIAVQFSNFAQTVAGEGGNVVGVIDQLSKRGADFASVMNLEVNDALGLFQSGLAGETEPLRKFGIDLSAASVEAFAYANGIAAAGTELTEAQKVQARYASLLEQTSKVQDDFANTSSSLANQQRILAAQYENFSAQVGDRLKPILAEFISDILPKLEAFWATNGEQLLAFGEVAARVAGDALIFLAENLIKLADYLINNKDALQIAAGVMVGALVPAIVAITAAVAPAVLAVAGFAALGGLLVFFVQRVVKGFRELAPVVKQYVTDKFEEAKEKIEDFKDKASRAIEAVKKFIQDNFKKIALAFLIISPPIAAAIIAFKLLRDNWDKIMETIKTLIQKGLDAVVRFFTVKVPEFIQKGKDLADGVLDAIKELPAKFLQFGRDTIDGFIGGLEEKFTNAIAKVTELGQKIIGAVKGTLGIQSPSKVFRELGGNTIDGFLLGIEEQSPDALAAMDRFVTGLTNQMAELEDADEDFIKTLEEIEQVIQQTYEEAADAVKQFARENADAQEDIQSQIDDTVEKIKDLKSSFAEDTAEAQQDFITDAASVIIEAQDKLQELKNDLTQLISQQPTDGDASAQASFLQDKADLESQIKDQENLIRSAADLQFDIDAEIQRQKEFNALNELEQLQFKFEEEQDARRLAFEQELADLQAQKNALVQSLTERQQEWADFTENLKGLDQGFTEAYQSELATREQLTTASVNKLIAEYQRLAEAAQSARSAGANVSSVGDAGFATGGFTGQGGDGQVAGTVHKGEYVVPAWMGRANPNLFGALEALRTGSSPVNNNNQKSFTFNIENRGGDGDAYSDMRRLEWMARYAF